MPHPDRVNAGYILDNGGELTLFDCGGGVSASFRKCGLDPMAVKQIVISHMHPDHISDLPLFIQMLYLAGKKDSLTIYLPAEAMEPVRAFWKAMYLFEENIPFECIFEPVKKSSVISINGITIHAIENTHLLVYSDIIREYGFDNKMQSFSYLVNVGDKTLLYSADLGSEKDLGPFVTDVDLLVVESTHIDVPSLLDMVADYNVKKTVLSHIAEIFDIRSTVAQAEKSGYEALVIAEDGMEIGL